MGDGLDKHTFTSDIMPSNTIVALESPGRRPRVSQDSDSVLVFSGGVFVSLAASSSMSLAALHVELQAISLPTA